MSWCESAGNTFEPLDFPLGLSEKIYNVSRFPGSLDFSRSLQLLLQISDTIYSIH